MVLAGEGWVDVGGGPRGWHSCSIRVCGVSRVERVGLSCARCF